MTKYFAFFVALCAFSTAIAQQDYNIEDIEVVSLQIPVNADDSGRSVTILRAEDIAELPVSTVDELLRYLPGVNVNSRGGFGVQTDLGMRGSTFSQVLVLIDGVRFSEPLTSHLNFSLPIPVSEIAQIEVVRGPASAMYGADAVGGLIHIKTKSFAKQKNGLNTSGFLYAGENALIDGDASISYKINDFTISGGAKLTQSDGEEFLNPNATSVASAPQTFNTDFDIKTYTVATKYAPNKVWSVDARYAKDDRDFAAKYFYTASAYDESREKTGNELLQLAVKRIKENNQTTLGASYRLGEDFFVFNPLFAPNDHETKRYFASLNHQHTTAGNVELGVGVQLAQQKIESTDRGNNEQDQIDAFFTTMVPVKDFHFMLSQRFGMNEDYGVSYSPQLSASYNHNRFMIRSSAGWAVRAPDFTERYVSYNIPVLSNGRNLGNPTLQEEKSFSIDLGGTYLPTENIKLSASVFYRDSEDLIDYVLTNASNIATSNNLVAGASYLYTTNVGEGTTKGLELEADWAIALGQNNQIDLHADYTNLTTDLDSNIDSKYLADHPIHLINFVPTVTLDNLTLGMTNQYVDRKADSNTDINGEIKDHYFISNAKLGYQINTELAAQARANNILNTQYQEIIGAPMPSRWLSAGIQWNLK